MNARLGRLALSFIVVLAAALGLGAMADTMLLKAKDGKAELVTFEHKAHTIDRRIACTRCHHNMAEVGTPPCAQCHVMARSDTPAPLEPGGPRALDQAFHGSCLSCHEAPPKGTSPPMECGQCHMVATPEPATGSKAQ